MRKSLLASIMLLAFICFVGTTFAGGPVCSPPRTPYCLDVPAPKPPPQIVEKEYITKRIAAERPLCKGSSKGRVRDCGPCPAAPILWKCEWSATVQGPEVESTYVVVKKAKLVEVKKPVPVRPGCLF